MLSALGRLWLAGANVDWAAVHAPERGQRIPLTNVPIRTEALLDYPRDDHGKRFARIAPYPQWKNHGRTIQL